MCSNRSRNFEKKTHKILSNIIFLKCIFPFTQNMLCVISCNICDQNLKFTKFPPNNMQSISLYLTQEQATMPMDASSLVHDSIFSSEEQELQGQIQKPCMNLKRIFYGVHCLWLTTRFSCQKNKSREIQYKCHYSILFPVSIKYISVPKKKTKPKPTKKLNKQPQ